MIISTDTEERFGKNSTFFQIKILHKLGIEGNKHKEGQI